MVVDKKEHFLLQNYLELYCGGFLIDSYFYLFVLRTPSNSFKVNLRAEIDAGNKEISGVGI